MFWITTMENYLTLIFTGPEQFITIFFAFVLWIGLAGLGSLFTNSDRLIEANPIFGWAVISGIFTLVGVVFAKPFFIMACVAAFLSFVGIYRSFKLGQPLFLQGMWRVFLLVLPLLWITAAMEPSQWDEFSHWLPAPKYLFEFNGFPTKERPFFGTHMLSAYPYGWPFLSYLAALIAGQFLSNIGSILNLLLILTFCTFSFRTAMHIASEGKVEKISWSSASVVVIFATLLNPTFVQKIVLTAYSDTCTSVLVGFSLLIGYYFLETLSERKNAFSRSYAWQLALVLSLLMNVRQANLVLVVMLILALSILAIRDSNIKISEYSVYILVVMIPAALVYVFWRYYVGSEFNNLNGLEAGFRPLATWNFGYTKEIIITMSYVAFKKIGFFAPMLVACYFAILGLIRFDTVFAKISILVAVLFFGYTSFLFLTYLGHFQPQQAVTAVSFWRYSTHNGMAAVAFLMIGLTYFLKSRDKLKPYPLWLKTLSIILLLTLPFGFAHKIRFDLEPPKPYFTTVAKDVSSLISKGAKVLVVDPKGTGESAKITYFYLGQGGTTWISAFTQPTYIRIKARLNTIPNNN